MTTNDTLTLLREVEAALHTIAARPDLPNPDRDADWKNCQKWSSHDAKSALPTIQELIRMASVGVDDYTEELATLIAEAEAEFSDAGTPCVEDKHDFIARRIIEEIRPHLAPAASVGVELSDQTIIDMVAIFNNPESPKIKCTECEGTGKLDIDYDEYPVRCDECEGFGYIQYAVNQTERVKQVREALRPHLSPVAATVDERKLQAEIKDAISGWRAGENLHETTLAIIDLFRPHLAPVASVAEPTEEMCDRARGFILGLDCNIRDFHAMQNHLDRGGYPTTPYIQKMAAQGAGNHITKWDVAHCIYQLMTQPPQAKGAGDE